MIPNGSSCLTHEREENENMSEMIERVAKAAGDVFTAEHDAIVEYMLSEEFALKGSSGTTTAMVDAMLLKIARAAIEAMREPTEDMLEAGGQMIYRREYAIDAWQTMIDAALAS